MDQEVMPLPDWLKDSMPVMRWFEYKGETYFGCVDFEKSRKGMVMVECGYCATKYLNGLVERRVRFIEKHFKDSKLNHL